MENCVTKGGVTVRLTAEPRLSAIYYALLNRGYGYHALLRDEAHLTALRPFMNDGDVPALFADARRPTCEAYAYWPRAFLLEAATLALTEDGAAYRDWPGLCQRIRQMGNIADSERDDGLWRFLADFPPALRQVMDSEGFRRYRAWEDEWLAAQTARHREDLCRLDGLLADCMRRYPSPVAQVEAVISPIKCVYSSDCHLIGERMLFVSGRFRVDSVIHESLHHAVHPAVYALRDRVKARAYPGLDASYAAAGPLNAFEEHAVRRLTEDVLGCRFPENLPQYLDHLLTEQENRYD